MNILRLYFSIVWLLWILMHFKDRVVLKFLVVWGIESVWSGIFEPSPQEEWAILKKYKVWFVVN